MRRGRRSTSSPARTCASRRRARRTASSAFASRQSRRIDSAETDDAAVAHVQRDLGVPRRAQPRPHGRARRRRRAPRGRTAPERPQRTRAPPRVTHRGSRGPSPDRRSAARRRSTQTSTTSPCGCRRPRAEPPDERRRPPVRPPTAARRPVVADVLGELAHLLGHCLARGDREVDEHLRPERLAQLDTAARRAGSRRSRRAASSRSSGRMPTHDRAAVVRGEAADARRARGASSPRTTTMPLAAALDPRLEHVHRRAADEAGDEEFTGRS